KPPARARPPSASRPSRPTITLSMKTMTMLRNCAAIIGSASFIVLRISDSMVATLFWKLKIQNWIINGGEAAIACTGEGRRLMFACDLQAFYRAFGLMMEVKRVQSQTGLLIKIDVTVFLPRGV